MIYVHKERGAYPMEIYERIRELRKNHLKMSMEAFGNRLGVSRDTINNIEHNRLARPDQKMTLYKLICSEFNVNEDWLLNGTGPMCIEPDVFSLDDFAKEHNATPLETEILKTYFELDPDIRKTLVQHFKEKLFSSSSNDDIPDTAEEFERKYPPIEGKDNDGDVV
jgi:transcriptional regulator with XRE-family HTH domain